MRSFSLVKYGKITENGEVFLKFVEQHVRNYTCLQI